MAGRLGSIVVVALLAACGSSPQPSAPSGSVPVPSSAAQASLAPASPSAASRPSPMASTPTSPDAASPAASPAVAVDAGLLSIVPAQGNGLDFQFAAATSAQVAADPRLATDVMDIAIGLYTVTGQSPPVDFAIVSVARLRDPKSSDDWFRAYRDSYDQAACAQAGGVTGNAVSQIAGREVFIGSCAGGARTYHVRTADGELVVSITAVGPARLGERIVSELSG